MLVICYIKTAKAIRFRGCIDRHNCIYIEMMGNMISQDI